MDQVKRKRGANLRKYSCPVCFAWHITKAEVTQPSTKKAHRHESPVEASDYMPALKIIAEPKAPTEDPKMTDIKIEICEWDANYATISDSSGNSIWVKLSDLNKLETMIKSFASPKTSEEVSSKWMS